MEESRWRGNCPAGLLRIDPNLAGCLRLRTAIYCRTAGCHRLAICRRPAGSFRPAGSLRPAACRRLAEHRRLKSPLPALLKCRLNRLPECLRLLLGYVLGCIHPLLPPRFLAVSLPGRSDVA